MTASEHVMDSVMEAREAVLRARCEARAMAFAYPPGDPRRSVMAYVEIMMAEATGMDPRTARHTLSRQCYCLFMEATHDVPTRYRVVKEPGSSARPRRADALLAIREGWTPTPEVAGRIGIPGRRAYEVMKRAERRGLVERRHASANLVEWKLTEKGMEMMESVESVEKGGERWRRRRP